MKLKTNQGILAKMIGIGVIGLVLIIVAIVALTYDFGKEPGVNNDTSPLVNDDESQGADEEEVDESTVVRSLAVVEAVDYDLEQMEVMDTATKGHVTLQLSGATDIQDDYGSPIVLAKIKPGYMVNVKYSTADYKPESVKIAAQVQKIQNLTSFKVDKETKTIQIDSDIYKYDSDLIVLKESEPTSLDELSAFDDLIIRAYQGTVWSVMVESGHGYVVLKNYEAYIGGVLEVGNRTSYTIEEDMKVPVSVGTHQIVITKDDMTPYSSDVFIEEEEEYIIDLSDLQPKVATVYFGITDPEIVVYVNDEIVEDPLLEQKMDYGEYTVRAEKEGYETFETVMNVNQPYLQLPITMEEEPMYINMTGPGGAEFYVDGIRQGSLQENQPFRVKTTEGAHILTLRMNGYNTWSQTVTIDGMRTDYYYTVSALEPLTPPTEKPDSTQGQEKEESSTEDVYDNN